MDLVEPIVISLIYSIIESLETKENIEVQLETALTIHHQRVIIDFEELKSSWRLNGARIFKTLFNMNDYKSPFAKKPMDKDDNGHLTILKTYNINITQWKKFMNFIRNGKIKYYDVAKKDEKYIKCLYQEIDDLYMGVFGVFGPFPVFDTFCENIENPLSKKNQNNNTYLNPMTPKEDIYNKYLWQVCFTTHFSHNHGDWSCTIACSPPEDETNKYYWRKLNPSTAHS
jgi:hypothetical protein